VGNFSWLTRHFTDAYAYHCGLRVWASPTPSEAIKLLFLTKKRLEIFSSDDTWPDPWPFREANSHDIRAAIDHNESHCYSPPLMVPGPPESHFRVKFQSQPASPYLQFSNLTKEIQLLPKKALALLGCDGQPFPPDFKWGVPWGGNFPQKKSGNNIKSCYSYNTMNPFLLQSTLYPFYPTTFHRSPQRYINPSGSSLL